jgi:hypothetical protein
MDLFDRPCCTAWEVTRKVANPRISAVNKATSPSSWCPPGGRKNRVSIARFSSNSGTRIAPQTITLVHGSVDFRLSYGVQSAVGGAAWPTGVLSDGE